MDAERLRDEIRAGRVDVDRLIDLIVSLSLQLEKANQRIAQLEKKIDDLEKRNKDLEKQNDELVEKLGRKTTKLDEPYSMQAEERRREALGERRKRKPPKRRGRIDTMTKLAEAVRTEQVYPANVPQEECWLSHTRPVWRLENGRAVLVAYEVYRGPRSQYGKIPRVLGRGEFGIEITLAIAYQVYVVGLSFDKVAQLFAFFQNLPLRKSQIDAMLRRLARHWESEFDILCELLANSMIVHADETSWSIRSVWAFVSENVRILLFGVPKDGDTLQQILDPATFVGTLTTENQQRKRADASQRCERPQDRPKKQDAPWCSPTNGGHQRARVAASASADLHARERHRRSFAVAGHGRKLLRGFSRPTSTCRPRKERDIPHRWNRTANPRPTLPGSNPCLSPEPINHAKESPNRDFQRSITRQRPARQHPPAVA